MRRNLLSRNCTSAAAATTSAAPPGYPSLTSQNAAPAEFGSNKGPDTLALYRRYAVPGTHEYSLRLYDARGRPRAYGRVDVSLSPVGAIDPADTWVVDNPTQITRRGTLNTILPSGSGPDGTFTATADCKGVVTFTVKSTGQKCARFTFSSLGEEAVAKLNLASAGSCCSDSCEDGSGCCSSCSGCDDDDDCCD